MMKVTVSFEKIRAEHRELRRRIARLQEQLDALEAAGNEAESIRHRASGVAVDLVRLHEELVVHFAEEETSGFFDELLIGFPEHGRELEKLRAQHAELLSEARRVVTDSQELAEGGVGSADDLLRRARDLLDGLLHHEQAETGLMQRVYTEDLGTP